MPNMVPLSVFYLLVNSDFFYVFAAIFGPFLQKLPLCICFDFAAYYFMSVNVSWLILSGKNPHRLNL